MNVSPWELIESCAEIAVTADHIDQHLADTDDHEAVAVLAVVIAEARQQLDEIKARAEERLISLLPRYVDKKTGEMRLHREYVVPGLDGPVTTHRKIRRTEWQHDKLWTDVMRRLDLSADDLAPLKEVLSLGWGLTGLSALGFNDEDYCRKEIGHETVALPKRKMEERGKVATSGEAA